MRIMYLTWGETPRSYGVFGSQVISQFINTRKITEDAMFYFVSGVPIINSGIFRDGISYIRDIRNIRSKFIANNITFKIIPILAPQNLINPTKKTFNLMHLFANEKIKEYVEVNSIDIVHCRSYHSAWVALTTRNKYNLKFKIVFDARGLWPEEVALIKKFKSESDDYIYFKEIEKQLLEKCDVTVSVSDTMTEHYKKLNVKRIETIYLSADINALYKSKSKDNSKSERVINFCYVGALSESTWHQTSQLLKIYEYLRSKYDQTKLTIITTSNHEDIKAIFKNIPENDIEVTSTKTLDELKLILNKQDVGILPYRDINNCNFTFDIGYTMLSTKAVEYLSSGLSILVNENCGGIASIVKNNKFGLTYNSDKIDFFEGNIFLDSNVDMYNFIKEKFDYLSNAERYRKLYVSLL